MEFDMNKYDGVSFHEDEIISKRIRALLLWFEFQVIDNEFSREIEIDFIDSIINTMVTQEWYEVAVFFKNLKLQKLKDMFDK